MQKRKVKFIFYPLILLLYGVLAVLVTLLVYRNGIYPSGSDTLWHLYKGEKLYQEILKGNWYPLLDMRWYNGVEFLRYWAPLPVYVMAGCIALSAGDIFDGYLLYIGIIAFIGAWIWLHIGRKTGRPYLGAFLGVLWFLLPINLFSMFGEGNLPRSLCMLLLPLSFYLVHSYLISKEVKHIIHLTIVSALITLCHPGYAVMILAAYLVLFVAYMLGGGRPRKALHCILAFILGGMLSGIWVYPALKGGIATMNNVQSTKKYFQSILDSLNPVLRIRDPFSTFYFGLAAFFILILGWLASKKENRCWFAAPVVILALSSDSIYPFFSNLEIGKYMWMLSLFPVALCMMFMGLIVWESLRPWILTVFCALLLIDSIPSFYLLYAQNKPSSVVSRMDWEMKQLLIEDTKAVTKQRAALMDLSELESLGIFLISDYRGETDIAYGADWESANTATNIMLLNEALEFGDYYYLFDRNIELGNDSVLVQVECLAKGNRDVGRLDLVASEVGYELVSSNDKFRLYHIETPEKFGVVSTYPAIAIGEAAIETCLRYPCMEQTDNPNLNAYTFGELSKYELIYLDGFTFTDKNAAEELIMQLSENGVRIIINAAGLPVEESTGTQEFLGVSCQPIIFKNGFPIFHIGSGIIDPELFPAEHSNWKTVFLSGLDKPIGYVEEEDHELYFYGKTKNENINFIGFSLYYYESLTHSETVGLFLDKIMDLNERVLPNRRLVPLSVEETSNTLTIVSPEDGVNTTLALQNIFSSNRALVSKDNLLQVEEGTTVISFSYPYFTEGLAVSIAALVIAILMFWWIYSFWNRREIKYADVFGVGRPQADANPDFNAMVPAEAKYSVAMVEWIDESGKSLKAEDVFDSGIYTVRILLESSLDERFDEKPQVTINNMIPSKVKLLSHGRLLAETQYEAAEKFHIDRQPEGGEGFVESDFDISWQINIPASVGYLQMKEADNWVIVNTIDLTAEQVCKCAVKSETTGEAIYRLAFILSNGRTFYSDEFRVFWNNRRTTRRMGKLYNI